MPADLQKSMRDARHLDQLVALRTDRNRWFVFTALLAVLALATSIGWYSADRRFADNVRVEWVKLDPSGGYTIQYDSENRPTTFFRATVQSLLSRYVKARYQKERYTVAHEYGIAYLFMSPQLQQRFLVEEHAPMRAARLQKCPTCNSVAIQVRTMQDIDKVALILPDAHPSAIYTTLVFVTETVRDPDGLTVRRANKIITLQWRIKSRRQIVRHREALAYDPLGIEIMTDSIKDDPTPVPSGSSGNS